MSRPALVQRRRVPEWEPRSGGVVVEPLAVLVVVSTVLAMSALFIWALRGIYFVGATLAWSIAVAVLVYVTKRATQQLDRQLIPLFQREDIDGVDAAIQNANLARMLGSRAYIGRRRGMAAMMRQDYGSAEQFFESAWRRSSPDARHDLIAPLCRIKYKLRKMRDMRELAEDWVRKDGPRSPSAWYFALGKIEAEGIDDETLETLVAEAGVAEERIDIAVRNEVFQRMAERSEH